MSSPITNLVARANASQEGLVNDNEGSNEIHRIRHITGYVSEN